MNLPFAEAQKIVGAALGLAALTIPAALVVNIVPLLAGMPAIATALCSLVALGITLIVAIQSRAIRRLRPATVSIVSLILLMAASGTAIGYLNFAKGQILPVETITCYVKLLVQSDDLKREMTHWEDYDTAFASNRAAMEALFEKDDNTAIALLFSPILLSQALFILAIVVSAWRLAQNATKSKPGSAADHSSAPPPAA
jgi:hypothetical protein